MKKILKYIWRLFLLSAVLGIALLTFLWFKGVKEREDAASVTINNIDFTTLTDGTYIGYYEGGIYGFRENSVEVVISNGEVISITNIINEEDKTDEFLEELYSLVLNDQTLEVDMISTATLTSLAYLKAIEDALIQASN